MMDKPMSRRTFLRGVGTVIALPMLEAMGPVAALAGPAKSSPKRMVFLFVPNGIHMQDWTPTSEGALAELPKILAPLDKMKGKFSILTGLTADKARPNGDGAGDHARSASAWLTGCQPRKTAGADIKAGISADQIAADKIGHLTRFRSLEIGCERGQQAGNCDSGYSCAYSSSISWRGEATPVAKEVDPRLVFDRLFSNGDPNETAEMRAKRNEFRKSVLDFALEDAKLLQTKLGAHDRRKLDEYFTSVREIEYRLAKLEQTGKEMKLEGKEIPQGIPAEYGEHLRLMGDMMILALQSDLTRVCTFMFANEGSNRPYRQIGISEGHHDLSHHGRDPGKQSKISQINTFQAQQLAYVLEKMDSVKEADGTLLDNSMVVYGSGISDGNRHNHDNLPILLAGGGGGTIKTGRHIRYANETPLTNLFLSLLDRMKVPAEKVGDSTGKLTGLL